MTTLTLVSPMSTLPEKSAELPYVKTLMMRCKTAGNSQIKGLGKHS